MSIVSVRYNDIYFNSGFLQITLGATVWKYFLPQAPISLSGLCTTLNSNGFTNYGGTTILNQMFTFAVGSDSQGNANTVIVATNVDGNTYSLDASGNMQGFLGIWKTYTFAPS